MKLSHEVPDSKEYVELRIAADFGSKDDSAAGTALGHSIFSVIMRDDDAELVAMGRLIGDGACYFQIVDLVVSPAHQGEGLDTIIMNEITEYLNRHAPKGAEVLIMADVSAIGTYQKYGFEFTYPKSISLRKTL
ncbi:GNAT family N-acetyltransferase [Paenibacillus mesophilus]|uniref:GNAT family N-acetyltransferase n=1 Tax=Paenibacillus mesophilus TaxID=2582849 RepID=UPI00110EB7B6|nr:GNAT family N-acetyltransferase [Paenibacillus mesophilus]TMV52245.1 GNAT family N-acetyltransferase [Paenibacillus mesophilus]